MTDAETSALVALLAELRAALDALAKAKGDKTPYEISVAVPAGSENYLPLKVKQMDKYITYWNLMAYDYAGSWSDKADYLANVYGGAYSGVSTDATTTWYLRNGANPKKFVIGMPLYGVGFENTAGIFQPYNGTGTGTWEEGIYDYKALPFDGAKVINDFKNISSYSYDRAKGELISYDTPAIAAATAAWLSLRGLAGAMFWELSGDKNGTESLVWITSKIMQKLDNTPNHLNYPGSQFDNVRAGMKSTKNPHRKRMDDHF
ncbi:hypothetical protein FRC07_014982 [Ceratobasidium sp. 392]|nr:hypothetical protein FRC07_014982 [Ceratobasidium sp. 392]